MTVQSGEIVSVEDSETDFMALQFALKAAGVTNPLKRCENGQIAMNSLVAGETCPLAQKVSLILLDLNLPGMDGRQLIKALRGRDPNREVPVIVLSTSSHPRDINGCYKAGADAYMVKPLELEEWETKVGALADFWLKAAYSEKETSRTFDTNVVDIKKIEGKFKKTNGRSPFEHLDQLTRAIEGEIIPRLLLAHNVEDSARWKHVSKLVPIAAEGTDAVAELARLVLEQDVAAAASYVESMRNNGTSIEIVYQTLVAPAARFVGDLWKADLCDFGQFSQAIDRLQQLLVEVSPTCNNNTMH